MPHSQLKEAVQYDETELETVDAPVAVVIDGPTFADFNLPEKLLQSLNRMQFNTPTPIQLQAIPLAMAGKDILGSAQTGTGKTGAFGIPLVAKLIENPNMTALVMTPTRELATQVMAMLQQLVPVVGIKTALLIGGEPMPKQFMQLKNVPRLVVGTPGRINDHLLRGTLKLHRTGFLVLDETDRMLDMGFSIQIDEIAKHLPVARQTLLFSATMPANIVKLSAKYMRQPERITVGSTTAPSLNIKQEMILVNESDKYAALLDQLQKREGSVIVFVKTKHGTEKLADKLCNMDFRADAIHGDLQQRKRDRVIQNFRDKKFTVLVATDVAARGLDIPHIEHVINYDLPQVPEDYIHRIGRTGRAGATGEAVNLLTPADKIKWRAIQRLIDPNAKQEDDRNDRGPQKRSNGGGFGKKPFGANKSFGGGSRPSYDDRPRYERSERPSEGGRPSFGGQRRDDRGFADRAPREDRGYSDAPRAPRENNDRPFARREDSRGGFGTPRREEGGRPSFGGGAPRRDDRRDGDRPFARREDDRGGFGGQRREGGSSEPRKSFGGYRGTETNGPQERGGFGRQSRPANAGGRPSFGGAPKPFKGKTSANGPRRGFSKAS